MNVPTGLQRQLFEDILRKCNCRFANCNNQCRRYVFEWMDRVNENRKKFDCSICFVSGKRSEHDILPCGHVFHTDCILPWFRSNNTCPTCRAVVPDLTGRTPGSFYGAYRIHLKSRISLINILITPELTQAKLEDERDQAEMTDFVRRKRQRTEKTKEEESDTKDNLMIGADINDQESTPNKVLENNALPKPEYIE